jgi:peptidoglycan/xylan/chitin deacetylase (PgdA/CDA1 family)
MKSYFVKSPGWLKMFYPRRLWKMKTAEKVIYLTFDDGPHPAMTTFVLDTLKKAGAKATFFCIGKNVATHPDIYQRILEEGHQTGNHTQQHLNGWKTSDAIYLRDVEAASGHISSRLFRPPYGRIKSSQARQLKKYTIVMWDVLSGDFDESISEEKCLKNVIGNTGPGSIVVFHDSEKAASRLRFVLPRVLEFFMEKGYKFSALKSH